MVNGQIFSGATDETKSTIDFKNAVAFTTPFFAKQEVIISTVAFIAGFAHQKKTEFLGLPRYRKDAEMQSLDIFCSGDLNVLYSTRNSCQALF